MTQTYSRCSSLIFFFRWTKANNSQVPSGLIEDANPKSYASFALISRPVNAKSIALDTPTSCVKRCDPPFTSGIPSCRFENCNTALSSTNRISHINASSNPSDEQLPLMEQIIGFSVRFCSNCNSCCYYLFEVCSCGLRKDKSTYRNILQNIFVVLNVYRELIQIVAYGEIPTNTT